MRNSKQSGFSFIEVLIAFLLIGIASLGLVKMQSFVEQRADFAVKSNQAMNIAEQKLEWFRTRGASSAMSSQASVSEFSTIVDGSRPNFSCALLVNLAGYLSIFYALFLT